MTIRKKSTTGTTFASGHGIYHESDVDGTRIDDDDHSADTARVGRVNESSRTGTLLGDLARPSSVADSQGRSRTEAVLSH